MTDTIFAPITGRGGAVTVLRLSGPGALGMTAALCARLPPARRASLRGLRGGDGALLDHALVTIFPAPGSFTGEDCVELALHGGRAVLAAASAALVNAGARPAEPGEFSRRAFFNGRLDLLQAEAIADLIAAETEAQRRLALAGADALHEACVDWRERLRLIMARQEVLIDFPDEDLPPEVEQNLLADIAALQAEISAAIAAAPNPVFPTIPAAVEVMRLVTKADLGGAITGDAISVKTGAGMDSLLRQLTDAAGRLTDTAGAAALARPRQIACARQTAAALEAALATTEPELRGEELRAAANALARLTGVIGVEEILDAVFGSFCIGK
jgi:tRNA modification GTPase